jgi:pyruvoyl-dependent arginine decarboxylase (PvlArgDC)
VYTQRINATKGLTISSAIGVGIPEDQEQNGMILEASIKGPKEKAEMLVRQMIVEAFDARHVKLEESVIVSSEMERSHNIACTVAAALLLQDQI